jgi:hypothetical protein
MHRNPFGSFQTSGESSIIRSSEKPALLYHGECFCQTGSGRSTVYILLDIFKVYRYRPVMMFSLGSELFVQQKAEAKYSGFQAGVAQAYISLI